METLGEVEWEGQAGPAMLQTQALSRGTLGNLKPKEKLVP